MARLHYLQTLFPDWTGNDLYLIRQIKDSIEARLKEDENRDSFENFSSLAASLREQSPDPLPASHAFISIDYSGKTWEPLFARQDIISRLKQEAGTEHIFLLVRGLRQALFPKARYRTQAREKAYEEATLFIDELARKWTTRSSEIHLLYI